MEGVVNASDDTLKGNTLATVLFGFGTRMWT